MKPKPFKYLKFKKASRFSWSLVFFLYAILLVRESVGSSSATPSTFCSEYMSPKTHRAEPLRYAAATRGDGFEMGAAWNKSTRTLVAFFRELLQHGKLGDEDLLKMRDELVQGKRVSPFPRAGNTNIENTQFAGVVNNLLTPELNTAHVILWIDVELHARDKKQNRREKRQEKTKHPFREIEFVRMDPSTFNMGEDEAPVPTTVAHPFAVMTTPVTQWMWVREFGENPSHHKVGDQTVEIVVKGKRILLQPDHPVENITWWSMAVFANRLTKRFGFQPAYDLNGVVFEPGTSAALGTLKALNIGISNRTIINHSSGLISKTNGIRMLTEAEWVGLATSAGQDGSDIEKCGWFILNSGGMTHAVGMFDGLKVRKSLVYDLRGNVWEWLWDYNSGTLSGGLDPEGPDLENYRVIRGGGYADDRDILDSNCRLQSYPNGVSNDTGGRLGFNL